MSGIQSSHVRFVDTASRPLFGERGEPLLHGQVARPACPGLTQVPPTVPQEGGSRLDPVQTEGHSGSLMHVGHTGCPVLCSPRLLQSRTGYSNNCFRPSDSGECQAPPHAPERPFLGHEARESSVSGMGLPGLHMGSVLLSPPVPEDRADILRIAALTCRR